MQRAPGWTRLAGIALELSVLAFLAYVLMGEGEEPERPASSPQAPAEPRADARSHDDDLSQPESTCHPEIAPAEPAEPAEPLAFLMQSAGEGARFYRAGDGEVELFAAVTSDNRIRLANHAHRFAGMLQDGHADLLQIETNTWSEIFLHETPEGALQLELRGGPYDARVLDCVVFEPSGAGA